MKVESAVWIPLTYHSVDSASSGVESMLAIDGNSIDGKMCYLVGTTVVWPHV